MAQTGLRSRIFRFSSLSLVAAGVTLAGVPTAPAQAFFTPDYRFNPNARDYASCTSSLIDTGIGEATAASACASALKPQDVSRCVTGINRDSLAATDVLEACTRVRRPIDLATCVNQIGQEEDQPVLVSVMDNCRRSLLPERFADCVTGVRNASALTTPQAMQTCISAGDRSRLTQE
ncbi:hypothetical protein ACQ4M4_17080 [Leptolyngbya sp. AN02str]|uniref:hypothetical protein n=1 Tax=Leptolyngbya sp. AN02str TaxID=3423363 RepID=UPI003D3157D0